MKSIKFIFAFLLFSTVLVSCTSDSLSADETLYNQNDTFSIHQTGEDGTAEIDRDRD